uniref:SAP domain-containing protein n=1 Tax=Angiostrongylus cantonensis TaxID=6313 RepID=A0A0K0DBV1_ANGCA
MIASMRVNELQTVLSMFKMPKLGKKQELIQRCTELLRTPSVQIQVASQVKLMVGKSNRMAPYQIPVRGYVPNGTMMNGNTSGYTAYRNTQLIHPLQSATVHQSIIPTNKPNVEPKRPSRPVDITQNCMSAREPTRPLRLMVEWTGDKRTWVVAVYLVSEFATHAVIWMKKTFVPNKHDLHHLSVFFMSYTSFQNHWQEEHVTRDLIRARLIGSGDDDIAMAQLKISLLCPSMISVHIIHMDSGMSSDGKRGYSHEILFAKKKKCAFIFIVVRKVDIDTLLLKRTYPLLLSRTRITLPARCKNCSHLQCFDLFNFLLMNEKRPTWRCPVCSDWAPFKNIIIDGYFKTLLADVDKEAVEVELLVDGSYRTVKSECIDVDDDDIPSMSATNTTMKSSVLSSKTKTNVDDIIVLSDSDDEEEEQVDQAIRRSLTETGPMRTTSSPRSNDSSIIIIDDETPPGPATTSIQNTTGSCSSSSLPSILASPNTSSSVLVSCPISSPSITSTSVLGAASRLAPSQPHGVLNGRVSALFSFLPI